MNTHRPIIASAALAASFAFASSILLPNILYSADQGAVLTREQKETFLKTAKITATKNASKGVTGTLRVTMTDGTITHDASVQSIDERQAMYNTPGRVEMNFRDSYVFNLAAWKLAEMLGIDDMMPPYVERGHGGKKASFSWWVDDVLMDEVQRISKKEQAPDAEKWAMEMNVMRVFDQLIFNVDRNAQNILIDKQWRIWMIDHTRSFRDSHNLDNPKSLAQCDRQLLAKLKALDETTLRKEIGKYLGNSKIKSLLARRDLIVKFFEAAGARPLFDRPTRL